MEIINVTYRAYSSTAPAETLSKAQLIYELELLRRKYRACAEFKSRLSASSLKAEAQAFEWMEKRGKELRAALERLENKNHE